MIIEESDFKMTYSESSGRWDLELKVTVKPRGKPEREEFKLWGYDMSIEKCLKIITNDRIKRNVSAVGLKEYLKQYKQINNDLTNFINERV